MDKRFPLEDQIDMLASSLKGRVIARLVRTLFMERLRQGDTGAYVNFLAEEGPERLRAAYPGATWERLRRVKRQYDPQNLFRLNHNIPPA